MEKVEHTDMGVVFFRPSAHADGRGMLYEQWSIPLLAEMGIHQRWVQANVTMSHANVLRGLHFQHPPHAQAKLVACLFGVILDVAVDIRPGSTTFGRWVSFALAPGDQVYIPSGFAHGFHSPGGSSLVHYALSASYHPEAAAGIRWDDPDLGIDWKVTRPTISARDGALPFLRDIENTLTEG